MGGYVIGVFEADDCCPFPDGRTRFLLQDETIAEVANFYPELLQLTPEHEIRDKSKASGVAKSIACVQASWFALQCLSRIVLTFPITLLEVCCTFVFSEDHTTHLSVSLTHLGIPFVRF